MSIVFAALSAIFLIASYCADKISSKHENLLNVIFKGFGSCFFFFIFSTDTHSTCIYATGIACLLITALVIWLNHDDYNL